MSLLFRTRALRSRLAIGGAMMAMVALTGCDERDANPVMNTTVTDAALPPLPGALPEVLPMTDAVQPVSYAPPVQRLRAARQLSYADPGDRGYAWIDRADTVFDVIGDAPPDYGFGYDGIEPWGWEAAGGYTTYAEPIGDDHYRYYYYEPGADDPYLVRDPWNSYGYSDGRIAAVYDAGGALLPLALASRRVDYGSRYYARGMDLRRAARWNRRGVAAPLWALRRPVFERAHQQWAFARERQPAWREWRGRDDVRAARTHVREERQIRRVAGQRFARWQQAGLHGRAPDFYARQQRRDDGAQSQAWRVAERQAERRHSVYERARADFAANRRGEARPARGSSQGSADWPQIREQRQAERAQRVARRVERQGFVGRDARGWHVERRNQRVQAQRAQAQRQQRVAARQQRGNRFEQRQAERRQSVAQRQQWGGQQWQNERSQRAERQQRAAQRQAAQARRGQAWAQERARRGAAERVQAVRQQQQAARRQQANAWQQQAKARQQERRARQQQGWQRQHANVQPQQRQQWGQQQRQQRGQERPAQSQAQRAAREQRAASWQNGRQAAMHQQRQQQRAERQAQRSDRQAQRGGGGGRGNGGGGERRGPSG